jgi:hypothetical protein
MAAIGRSSIERMQASVPWSRISTAATVNVAQDVFNNKMREDKGGRVNRVLPVISSVSLSVSYPLVSLGFTCRADYKKLRVTIPEYC